MPPLPLSLPCALPPSCPSVAWTLSITAPRTGGAASSGDTRTTLPLPNLHTAARGNLPKHKQACGSLLCSEASGASLVLIPAFKTHPDQAWSCLQICPPTPLLSRGRHWNKWCPTVHTHGGTRAPPLVLGPRDSSLTWASPSTRPLPAPASHPLNPTPEQHL